MGTDGVPQGRTTIQGGSNISEAQNGVTQQPVPCAPCEQQTPAGLVQTERTGSKGDWTCSPQRRSSSRASPGLDGPLLGDVLETSLDSPWDGEGSADRAPDDGAACLGARPRCLGCTVLRAELDAAREELKITQGRHWPPGELWLGGCVLSPGVRCCHQGLLCHQPLSDCCTLGFGFTRGRASTGSWAREERIESHTSMLKARLWVPELSVTGAACRDERAELLSRCPAPQLHPTLRARVCTSGVSPAAGSVSQLLR